MRKILIAATIAVTALPAASPAYADPPPWAPAHGYRAKKGGIAYRQADGVRYWRGEDGRYYCKRSNGTTGLLVGAALGALLGRAIDTRGDRATGTIVGAAARALIGKEIAEGPTRCR